ncbi:MAG: ABC transporter ATP-binding protein [Deltaproteobacteria bacterium]|nr:MAG: ABC transporter ATP-binding protein [Deltaproteobacteria bacterium]
MTTLLSIRDLRVAFKTDDGDVTAVDGIDYELAAGETLGIVGESGSGKSVTNLALMRLLPPPPASRVTGEILFDGVDLLKASARTLREIRGGRIAMIFQDPMTSLNPFLRVGTQLVEMLRVHDPKMKRKEARARALAMLERVGIPAAARRFRQYPHEFSGGMRQRVMIAMMLLNDPELLIADEPTTALDVTIQAQILDLLRDLQAERKMAIALITHDLGVVAGMASHILVMYSGKVMEESSSRELFETPSHPYTIGLMRSIPRPDLPEGRRLFSIPGRPPDLDRRPPGCPFAPRCSFARDLCHREHPPETRLSATHRVFCWAVDDVRAAVAAGQAGLTAEERAR